MKIALLHTSDVHIPTFRDIFAKLDPAVELSQHTRADLLDDARTKGLEAVRGDTLSELIKIASADAAICTCSTLGPIVDDFNAPNVLRIDRALMQAACENGPRILVCICLESTIEATTEVLNIVSTDLGIPIKPTVLLCHTAWRFFEAGDQPGFINAICKHITTALSKADYDCVVLAQASMHGAAWMLAGDDLPVLSSPKLAALKALEIARAAS